MGALDSRHFSLGERHPQECLDAIGVNRPINRLHICGGHTGARVAPQSGLHATDGVAPELLLITVINPRGGLPAGGGGQLFFIGRAAG